MAAPPIQKYRELSITLFASLRANPIAPTTPPAAREEQRRLINELTDGLAADTLHATLIWGLVPPDLRQAMLLSGLAAIDAVIEQQQQINEQPNQDEGAV